MCRKVSQEDASGDFLLCLSLVGVRGFELLACCFWLFLVGYHRSLALRSSLVRVNGILCHF
jgi:hypothetical protein